MTLSPTLDRELAGRSINETECTTAIVRLLKKHKSTEKVVSAFLAEVRCNPERFVNAFLERRLDETANEVFNRIFPAGSLLGGERQRIRSLLARNMTPEEVVKKFEEESEQTRELMMRPKYTSGAPFRPTRRSEIRH